MATAGPPIPSSYIPFEAATSRTAPVNVAFGAIFLLIGSALCVLGRRAWRLTCAIAVGLAFELVAAAVMLNTIGATGFDPGYSATDNDLATFGIITGAGLASSLLSRFLPRKWCIGWWLGWALLGPLAGISAAFTVLLLKSGGDLLFESTVGRWVLAAILAVIGLVAVTLTKWTGASLATCLIGSWLLALGVDLILNTNMGASKGLRKLLDSNSLHEEALLAYDPPLSTKLLFSLSWIAAFLFFLLQWFFFKERWFLQITPSDQQRSWKHWFCPFLLRSSFTRPSTPERDRDREKQDETTLAEPHENGRPGGSNNRRSRSLHSRQNSTPDSSLSMDADMAERESLASGSDLRALTRNYRRALEILESEDGHDRPSENGGTVQIPIYYRPSPVNLLASPSPDMQEGGNVPPVSPGGHNQAKPLLKRTSPSRPTLIRTGPSSPKQGLYGQGDDQVPDLGAARRRADSDRGTSYSIPLTNITSSEYKDRDMYRPPSWTGDLPWHPSMLRGELDPATLPRHPQEEPHQLMPGIDAIVGHVVPTQPAPQARRPLPVPPAAPPAVVVAPVQDRLSGTGEDEYEMVGAEGIAQNGKPSLQISQPFQMAYASRPASREGISNPLAVLTAPASRNIPKVQRTETRERHMFPAEDDLPDHTPSSPEGATFPPVAGHSRLHTSETVAENVPGQRHARDDYATEVETSGDDDEGPAVGDTSSHASYSISHYARNKRRNLAAKWKGKTAQKHIPSIPTESSESEVGMPIRPITQSDMTPQLQDIPAPSRPTLVYSANPPISNHASLTGTPRTSGLNVFSGSSQVTPPLPVPQCELSESTVRPGQERRRSQEMDTLAQHDLEAGSGGEADGKKVRFFDSGSRKTLKDRFLRRQ